MRKNKKNIIKIYRVGHPTGKGGREPYIPLPVLFNYKSLYI